MLTGRPQAVHHSMHEHTQGGVCPGQSEEQQGNRLLLSDPGRGGGDLGLGQGSATNPPTQPYPLGGGGSLIPHPMSKTLDCACPAVWGFNWHSTCVCANTKTGNNSNFRWPLGYKRRRITVAQGY